MAASTVSRGISVSLDKDICLSGLFVRKAAYFEDSSKVDEFELGKCMLACL